MWTVVFWVMRPCSLVCMYVVTGVLNERVASMFDPEDLGDMLQNVSRPNHISPRRSQSTVSSP